MREILFRGKRFDNGKWVEGLLWKKKYDTSKLFMSYFPNKDDDEDVVVIDPETVGEYTGLKDTNGKKIFEGDIVQYDKDGATYEIVFAEECGVTKFCSRFIPDGTLGYVNQRRDKVIGNRWDNPELLQEKNL